MNCQKEIAKYHLDEWNDVTGFVESETGYYFEILSVIEDAMQEYDQTQLQELREKVKEQIDISLSCKKDVINQHEAGYRDGQLSAWENMLNLIDQLQED